MKRLLVLAALLLCLAVPAFAFKAVFMGDSRNDNKGILPAIANEAAGIRGLAVAVHTGDMTGAGREDEFLTYRKATAPIRQILLAVPGNHEKRRLGLYRKYVGPLYESRRVGFWRFVLLDNSTGRLGVEQLMWLRGVLAGARAEREHVAIFMHIPLFFPGRDEVMYGSDRKSLLRLIRDYGVKLVVSGHIHGYAKVQKDGVTYLTTGGAGAPLYIKGQSHHYVLADLRDDGTFDLQVRKVSGLRGR